MAEMVLVCILINDSKLVDGTNMRKNKLVMRRTTSDHFWLYEMKRRCMKFNTQDMYDV